MKLTRKTSDLILLLIYPILAGYLALVLKMNALASVFIFFVLPVFYLSAKNPKLVKKSFFFSLLAIPVILIVDYIAEITGAWLIPNSVLPYRLFGQVTVEVVLWAFFNMFFVIMFYEYFVDKHRRVRVVYPRFRQLVSLTIGLFVLFMALVFLYPDSLKISFWYLKFGIISILIPILLEKLWHPSVFWKLIGTGAYFFYISLIYEVVALKLNWWSFPGNEFVGQVSFLGVAFPVEEFVFWLVLFAIATLSYYEYFDDDEK